MGARWITVGILACLLVEQALAFTRAFDPQQSKPFVPSDSSSFNLSTGEFGVKYADNTELQGLVGTDYVQLGKYHVKSRFGIIVKCNSPDFNGVDGILGLGLPPDLGPMSTVPRPLLFQLTDSAKASDPDSHILKKRIFSFMSSDGAGELQLGGVDPNSIDGELMLSPTIGAMDYRVPVFGMWYGKKPLLDYVPHDPRLRYVPAIIDSGSSCLVLPDDTLDGLLHNRPFTSWKELAKNSPNDTFYLDMSGIHVEIPWSVWFLSQANKACVQSTPKGFPGILMGDVLFRRYVVQFDLSDPKQVVIGIAPQNPKYVPVQKPTEVVLEGDWGSTPIVKHPMSKKVSVHSTETSLAATAHLQKLDVDNLPIINKHETQYFIELMVGSPPVPHVVTFDTGSSVFGIFSKVPSQCKAAASPCMFSSSIFDDVNADKPSLLLTKSTTSSHAVARTSAEAELAETSEISSGLAAVHAQLDQVKSKLLAPLKSLQSADWRHSMLLRQGYLQQLKASHAQLLQILEIECLTETLAASDGPRHKHCESVLKSRSGGVS